MIMMYQCMFIDYNKCTIAEGDINCEGEYCERGEKYIRTLCISSNFAVNLKQI